MYSDDLWYQQKHICDKHKHDHPLLITFLTRINLMEVIFFTLINAC
jgi:hypothetical protein